MMNTNKAVFAPMPLVMPVRAMNVQQLPAIEILQAVLKQRLFYIDNPGIRTIG